MMLRAIGQLALATALVLSAEAQPPNRPRANMPAGGGRAPLQQLAAIVQRRLGLNDEQAAKLRQTTGRFAVQRQELLRQEREARRALRLEMERGDSANQPEVARRLDALLQVQKQRVELMAGEQRDLAGFLTPVQRAQFLAMQERAFRAAQQLQQQKRRAAQDLPKP